MGEKNVNAINEKKAMECAIIRKDGGLYTREALGDMWNTPQKRGRQRI